MCIRDSRQARELPASLRHVDHLSLPTGVGPNDERAIIWAMDQLADYEVPDDGSIGHCPRLGEHRAAWADVQRLEAKLEKRRRSTSRRVGRLEQQFDGVADLLHEHGFASDWQLTGAGELLTAVHGDTELVLAEALHEGTFARLDPPELAAALSALSYEARRGVEPSFRWPSKGVRQTVTHLKRRAEFHRRNEEQRLDRGLTRIPDADLVAVVYDCCLLYTSPSPRDATLSRMPSSA